MMDASQDPNMVAAAVAQIARKRAEDEKREKTRRDLERRLRRGTAKPSPWTNRDEAVESTDRS